MRRRHFTTLLLATLARPAFSAATEPHSQSITGALIEHGEKAPSALRTQEGRTISLSGDEETEKVLHDPRLAGMELEALGRLTSPEQFAVEPRFEKNMFIHKDGKRLLITYWCDICSIRTYAPGVCVCCQKWTDLDLQDPNQK
jgi:hypothetical protein